eukprot:m.122382 g.122382  ORF g.122382 m.122382 type:complete len:125 (-) comp13729_c0_seq2:715-1089(-)
MMPVQCVCVSFKSCAIPIQWFTIKVFCHEYEKCSVVYRKVCLTVECHAKDSDKTQQHTRASCAVTHHIDVLVVQSRAFYTISTATCDGRFEPVGEAVGLDTRWLGAFMGDTCLLLPWVDNTLLP